MAQGLLHEVDRINEIIEGLLSFSTPVKPQIEQVDLQNLIQQTINLVANTAQKHNNKIILNFNASQKHLRADPAQLKQVFLNIIMNALHAMEKNGELKISVESMKQIPQFIDKSQNFFYIVFQDTGRGIPIENTEKVFDPFFTTKKDGTGLGLSISYAIIHQHKGEIEIKSDKKNNEGKESGTKVIITLPIAI